MRTRRPDHTGRREQARDQSREVARIAARRSRRRRRSRTPDRRALRGRAALTLSRQAIASLRCTMTGMAALGLHGGRSGGRHMSDRMRRHHIWRGLKIAAVSLGPLVPLPPGANVIELTWLVVIVLEQVVAYRVVRAGETRSRRRRTWGDTGRRM